MKKKIMKKTFLLSLLAFFTSIPMSADVAINATNFPDANLRKYVKETIMGNASATTLTTTKIQKTYSLNFDNNGIVDFTGIEYFTELRVIIIQGNPITTLDVSNLTKLAVLTIRTTSGSFEDQIAHSADFPFYSLDLSHNKELTQLHLDNVETLDISENTKLKVLCLVSSKLASLDLSEKNNLHILEIYGMPSLNSLILPTNKENMTTIDVFDCPLLNSLDISACSSLKVLRYKGNGFKYVDNSNFPVLKIMVCPGNGLTSLDVSNNPALQCLDCSDNYLTSLDLSNNTALRGLRVQNNLLTEIDLSKNPNLWTEMVDNPDDQEQHYEYILMQGWCYQHPDEYNMTDWVLGDYSNWSELIGAGAMINTWYVLNESIVILSPQNLSKDYISIDGRSKLGIQCNTNDGVLTSYGDYTTLTSDGNNYIVVADETINGKTDVHAPNGSINYNYITGYTGERDAAKTMEVNIGTSAHGMYIHPETLRGSDNFYSGTLYLEFPAKIPEGVQCYYAKGLDANEDLVGLTEVTGTIPANTAVIVKAPSEYKFFAFNESEETPAAPTDNIIKGTIEGLSVTPGSVLTLGHNTDRSTGEYDNFGFWNYRGNKISPFRAYIPKYSLSSGAKNGFSLVFPEDNITGIARLTNDNTAENGTWYTLSGTRINGKPTTKGIYVNNGQKIVIR